MFNFLLLTPTFHISSASPLDAITVFLNKLLGSHQTPDGYLMYLLVMCGLLIIGLVLIYNWWEEKRFNEQVEKSFSPIKNDALLDQNKKQFLEKFAATTGYLSDAPDASSFPGQKVNTFDDHRSIDDVYSELLDTMSKRTNQKEKSPEEFNLPDMIVEPKDAPLSQISVQEAVEEKNDIEEPAQHSAIRSIIDQVFKSKNNQEKTNQSSYGTYANDSYDGLQESSQEAPASAQQALKEAPATVVKDASALDAFLTAKKAFDAHSATQQMIPEPTITDEVLDDIADGVSSEFQSKVQMNLTNINLNLGATNSEPAPDLHWINGTTEQASENSATLSEESNLAEKKSAILASDLPKILNLQVDLVGELVLETGIAFSLLAESFSALYKEFDKPVYVHALGTNGQWVLINDTTAHNLSMLIDSGQPQKIVCSMQLADRSGAVSRNVINRFQMAFEAIAVNMGGRVQWKNEGDIFSQAMALDAFCIEVDKTMFFHLMHESTGPFTGTKLKGLAESQGLTLANDGAFKYFEPSGAQYPEFVMFNRDNHPFNPEMLRTSVVKAVTFQLDIPHARPNSNALDQMVSIARYMEIGLNAILVDDNNRPLEDAHIDRIRDQIRSIHAMMQLRGIAPGSDDAHRLFS